MMYLMPAPCEIACSDLQFPTQMPRQREQARFYSNRLCLYVAFERNQGTQVSFRQSSRSREAQTFLLLPRYFQLCSPVHTLDRLVASLHLASNAACPPQVVHPITSRLYGVFDYFTPTGGVRTACTYTQSVPVVWPKMQCANEAVQCPLCPYLHGAHACLQDAGPEM
jgi:hypothetical protein